MHDSIDEQAHCSPPRKAVAFEKPPDRKDSLEIMSKPDNSNQFILYTAPDGAVKVEVFYKDETVWLTQKALAELFGVKVPGINKHLKNVFESGELVEDSAISILETTAADGKNYQTRYYNLDAIIAVGYRVNSYQATQFRIWATQTLREFLIKGFVLDDERLKQGKRVFGKDYLGGLGAQQSYMSKELNISQRAVSIVNSKHNHQAARCTRRCLRIRRRMATATPVVNVLKQTSNIGLAMRCLPMGFSSRMELSCEARIVQKRSRTEKATIRVTNKHVYELDSSERSVKTLRLGFGGGFSSNWPVANTTSTIPTKDNGKAK